MNRRLAFRTALVAGLFFLLGFVYEYPLPRLESFLLVEIERASRLRSPVRIFARKLDFHLLPLGVVLKDVKVKPMAPVDRFVAPFEIKQIGLRVALWPLLRGDLRVGLVFVRDADLNLFLRQELFADQTPGRLKLDFNQIYDLPIDEIRLEGLQVQARIEPQDVVMKLSGVNLTVENRYRSVYADIQIPAAAVKPSGPMKPLNLQLEFRALIEEREAQVSALKIRADDSFLVASGRFNGDLTTGRIENGAFDTRAKVNLADLNVWERVFFPKTRIPVLSGGADFDVSTELRGGKPHKLSGHIGGEAIQIEKYVAGSFKAQVLSDFTNVSSPEISLWNDSGRAKLTNVRVGIEKPHDFAATAVVESVEVRRFLENLDIDRVPIELPVRGRMDCAGQITGKTEMKCAGDIASPRVLVHSGPPTNTPIVDVRDLSAKGTVRVTDQQVEYSAQLKAGKASSGSSTGLIHYDKGFKIQYVGDKVAFADVQNLVNLKFEGELTLKGSTEGTSDWATIDMKIDGKEVWLEDYPLGQLSSRMTYKAGQMHFSEAQGLYGVTRYNGSMHLDLIKDRLRLSMQVPFADVRNIQSMFQRKVELPFETAGTGTGNVVAEGPFAFNALTYTLRSTFYRGMVANETFDELTFNVSAKDGFVQSDRIFLTKANGVVEMKGRVNPNGEIDTVAVGRSLRLEQSENLTALGFDMQGLGDFTVLIRGQLPRPRIEVNGRASKMILADRPAEDSVFKLNFMHDRMEGSGQFFGTTLTGDFSFPYTNEAPFHLRVKSHKWDFTTLFALVSRSARQMDFETSVTMDVNILSPKGGFWAASGMAKVDEFVLRKGSKSLTSNKPMVLTMNNGTIQSKDFTIGDGDSFLKLDVAGMSRNQLSSSINGKLDISLLGLFTPFISDLRGQMAVSVDLKGSVANPALSGSAYIEKGYAKFTDFVHPFANVRADLLFNDNQMVINSVQADLAGGRLSGDGRIAFSRGNYPVDVRGRFNDVRINVPEGFKTNGSGNVSIRGNHFPYTLAVDYKVNGGEVISEFAPDDGGTASVKASAYLPRFLSPETFHPFTFALAIDLKSPVTVNNSLMLTPVTGQVTVNGTPDRLLMTGTLNPAPGGKVYFRDTEFDIASAFIEYNNNPPEQPKIYLTANTRKAESVQDETLRTTENQYDINLLVQGKGPNPEITLTSQPPLSQREIVSLLALGVTTSGLDQGKSSDFQAANTSTAVGAALLQKASGRRLKDTLGVDLKVSSSQPTPDAASTPKVTLSKQWTPKFGASASSTLQANPRNDVKVEYKMNKNISVIGTWDGREARPTEEQEARSVFGLDLEYKIQFK